MYFRQTGFAVLGNTVIQEKELLLSQKISVNLQFFPLQGAAAIRHLFSLVPRNRLVGGVTKYKALIGRTSELVSESNLS